MAYLGRSLSNGSYLKLDDISSQFNGSSSTFNLTSGGQAFYPSSSYSILVILSGVVQEADTAYQVLNNQIIFAAPPDSSDTFYCLVLGVALGVGVVGDGTITTPKIAEAAVTPSKLSASARGVGIQSGGVVIGAGITQLNFIGAGNTFALNGTTVDVSIAGGGGGGGGGLADPVNDTDGIFNYVSTAATVTSSVTLDTSNSGSSSSFVLVSEQQLHVDSGVTVTVGSGKKLVVDALQLPN